MHWLILAILLAAVPPPAASAAQGPAQQDEEEKKKLEKEIEKELGAKPQAPRPVTPGTTPPLAQPSTAGQGEPGGAPQAAVPGGQGQTAPQGQTGGNPFARLLLLPDISAIGSVALAWNRLDVGALSPRGDPFAPPHTLEPIFQELELGVQAVVDPFARADVFISFADEGVEIEEAYLTTLRLPYALQARVGKFFVPIGRQNQQHGHIWDFVDRPLALARLLGVDALKGPGVDLAWLAPLPWYAELRFTFQSAAPDLETRARGGVFGRFAQFFDVGAASTLGLGLAGGRMGEGGSSGWRDLAGVDAYLKIRPPQTRSYLALQGEVVARHLDEVPRDAESAIETAGWAYGGYAQAVLRDGPYFEYGVRYERAPALTGGPEHRASLLAGWLPSEFQRLRVQVSYDRLPGGQDGLEAILQAEFAVGAHGAHPF
jgi:hypothetical protein